MLINIIVVMYPKNAFLVIHRRWGKIVRNVYEPPICRVWSEVTALTSLGINDNM